MKRILAPTAAAASGRSRASVLLAALLAVLLGVLTVGPMSSADARPSHRGEKKPTIVLVHGAWASAPGWDEVAGRLKRDGYRSVAPELGLASIEADVEIVRTAMDARKGPKLLVAHSYGGIVASNAAVGRDDVVGIVYTAAYVPDEGDDIAHMGAGEVEYALPAVLDHLVWTGTPWESSAYIAPDAFREVFAADLGPRDAGLLNAGQRPASAALLVSPSGPVAWRDLPTWYAVSGEDRVIDEPLQRWMAARAGSEVVAFPTASHVGGYTRHAARFTKLIERAAESD